MKRVSQTKIQTTPRNPPHAHPTFVSHCVSFAEKIHGCNLINGVQVYIDRVEKQLNIITDNTSVLVCQIAASIVIRNLNY